jgi:hypothetical protein
MMHLFSLILTSLAVASSHNISPTPNIVFRAPDKNSLFNVTKPSLFGYSLNLRKNSILIGAPKSQSSQENVNEPGVVYKCSLADESSCRNFVFDNTRNMNSHIIKDDQLFGWAMDGLDSDQNSFMTCAPKQITSFNGKTGYPMGICYKTDSTSFSEPYRLRQFTLNYNDKREVAQCGFSVHAIDETKFIFGCPGKYFWEGSVYLFDKIFTELDSLKFIQENHVNYFGYAVSSGKFTSSSETYFVVSAPRINYIGQVFVFGIDNKLSNMFEGTQMGEYFGYSILTEDFNGDSLPDLAISAPSYSKDGKHDHGAVYIYINKKNVRQI